MSALLDVRGLTVSYGGLLAAEDVSFSVAPSAIVGLIGPNGAGKTTTIDAVCGFVPYLEGTVLVGGRSIDALAPHQRAREGLVRTFQSVELFDDLTVRENLLVGAVTTRWWSPFVDAILPRRNLRSVDVEFALDVVSLRGAIDARPPELSHGQRQLIGVARAIACRPRVLVLDEPAAGLDPAETAALATVLRTLPDADVGVLLVDHDMTLVLDVCHELTVLDLGRVIAQGARDLVRDDPAVIAAYLGDTT